MASTPGGAGKGKAGKKGRSGGGGGENPPAKPPPAAKEVKPVTLKMGDLDGVSLNEKRALARQLGIKGAGSKSSEQLNFDLSGKQISSEQLKRLKS